MDVYWAYSLYIFSTWNRQCQLPDIHAIDFVFLFPAMNWINKNTDQAAFYTFGDALPGAKAFIDFMIGSKGQKVAEEYGFIQL